MQIIIDLQHRQLLDEQTALLIKKLILEENVDVQRVLRQYTSNITNDI